MTEIKEQIDGYGKRLGKTELKVAGMEKETDRNTSDIQKIFEVSDAIKASVDKGKWQVLVMVSVPVLILIVQLLMKASPK